jgi:hypothetical protein
MRHASLCWMTVGAVLLASDAAPAQTVVNTGAASTTSDANSE